MSAKSIAVAPVFRLDEFGSIIGPANTVIATKDEQVYPTALVLDIDALNNLVHMAISFAMVEDVVRRGRDRARLDEARAALVVATRCSHIVDNYTNETCGLPLPCKRHR